MPHAGIAHRHAVVTSMLKFIQKQHAPGKERDDTYATQFYDALCQIYHGSSGNSDEALAHSKIGSLISEWSISSENYYYDEIAPKTSTFYFYVAGGVDVEALP